MGVKCLIGGSQTGTSTANTTQYWGLVGEIAAPVTVEANAQFVIRTGGFTATKLYIKVFANTVAATSTFRTRKNLANGNLSVSVGSNATGDFEDTTNSDTLVTGDDYCLQTVPGAATGTYSIRLVSLIMESDQTNIQQPVIAWAAAGTIGAANSTRFITLGGASNNTTTEANHQTKIKKAGTFKNLAIYVSANPRTTDTTFAGRKGGVTTTMAVTITASTTGWFEEQVDTETVAVDNLFCLVLVSGSGSSTMTYHAAGVYFTNANRDGLQCSTRPASATQVANETRNWPLVGRIGGDLTESLCKMKTRLAFTYSNLSLYLSTNSVTAASTIRFRKNEANGNQTASIGSSATGWFHDTTNTDTVADTDYVNYQITTGATGTSITPHFMGVWALTPVSGVNITRALATETMTVGAGTIARETDKIRARTDTAITVGGGTIARLSVKNRPLAAQTITVGVGAAARIKGKVKSLATETIIVGAGTIAELAAKIRTRSETVVIAENRARLVAKNRALTAQTTTVGVGTIVEIKGAIKTISQTIIIGENLARLSSKIRALATQTTTIGAGTATRLKASLRALATQTVSIGENLARIKGAIRALATQTVTVTGGSIARLSAKIRALATQTVVLTEDLQRTLTAGAQNIVKTITQTVTLGESSARLKASQRLTSQTITVGAGTIARLTTKIRAISQTIVLSDNRARLSAKLRVLAVQTVIIADNRSQIKGAVKTISQTIILSENRARLAAKTRILAAQTVALADSVARQIIGGPVEIIRSLTQTVVLSETLGRRLNAQRILSQTVPIAENLARVRGVLRTLSQSIPLSESRSRIKSALRPISQTISTSDSINRLNALRRTVIQTTAIAENVAAETVGNLVRALVETVTVSDSIIRRTVKLVILAQTITIAEQASRLSAKLRTIQAQTIILSDSATSELNVIIKHTIRTLAQAITITEYAKIEVVKRSQRFRKILDPSIKRLKSNHPAWFLGSRGLHDHYEEFSP